MRRDGHCCLRCGASVIDRPHSIHHRKLRKQGGTHAPDNLVLLCGSGTTGCHGWVHAHVAAATDDGWLVRSSEDPAVIGVPGASEHGSGMTLYLHADGSYRDEDGNVLVAGWAGAA